MTTPKIFDRDLLNRHRSRAAAKLGRHDFLFRHAAAELRERLASVPRGFERAADFGADGGIMARLISEAMPQARVVSFRPVAALALSCRPPRVVASEDAQPLKQGAFDLVTSVLSLQLVNDLPGALIQMRRALRPGGLFLAALLGGGSLAELRQAFLLAEQQISGGVSPRVFPSADVREMGALLQRAGFALPVADTEPLRVTYANALALMRDLKAMGAANALEARSRTPLRRETLFRAAEIYAERFPAENGRVRATFEIIYLGGWAPAGSEHKLDGAPAAWLANALETSD